MKSVNSLNFIVLCLVTIFFTFTSLFPDISYHLDLVERIKNREVNFKDYLCFLNNIALYPLIFFGDIVGYSLAYFILAVLTGIAITYFAIQLHDKVFEKETSISKYFLFFFFILPFGMSGYYIDIILYLFGTISIFFYFKKGFVFFYLSSFLLSVCFILKYFNSIPFLIGFGAVFLLEWYYNNFKINFIIKPLKFFLFFFIFTIFLIFFYTYLNQINIEMFSEYLFKEMIDSGESRIENLFKNLMFLNYNFFSAILNFKIGTLLFYLFVICFYFCIILLLKLLIKKENKNQALLLVFLIVTTSFTFILAGRDFNHKILYMPILLLITIDCLNSYFSKNKFFLRFNYSYLFLPLVLIYTLVPLNERFDIKENKLNVLSKEHFNKTFIKIEKGRFKNLYYSLRSNYLKDNGLSNYVAQINEISVFIDSTQNKNSELTNKKDITPCCGISYESFPPKYELNKKKFVENYMINLNKTSTLLIVCYIDIANKNLCINKAKTENNRNFAIPGDFDRFPELKKHIDQKMEVFFSTENFVVYKNIQNI